MSSAYSSNSSLTERLRNGDAAVLGPLFDEHRPHLKRMVRFRMDRRLRGRVDISDVVQQVYIDAAQRLDHYVSGSERSFLVWLRQVAEQSLVDLYRRHLGAQRRDVRRERPLDRAGTCTVTSRYMAADLAAQMTSPSQRAVRAEFEATLELALAEMSDMDQEVLALRHFEELANSQVAEILGLSPAAASNRYFRALARLRVILKSVPGFFEEYAPEANSASIDRPHESRSDSLP